MGCLVVNFCGLSGPGSGSKTVRTMLIVCHSRPQVATHAGANSMKAGYGSILMSYHLYPYARYRWCYGEMGVGRILKVLG